MPKLFGLLVCLFVVPEIPEEPHILFRDIEFVGTEDFLSGPQVGSKIPGPFEPILMNGPNAGDAVCLYCQLGNAPTVMIFAPKPTDRLASLIRQLDKILADAAKEVDVGACLVVMDTSQATQKALKHWVDQHDLRYLSLGIINSGQLKIYLLTSETAVTIILYSNRLFGRIVPLKPVELTEGELQKLVGEVQAFLAIK